MYSELGILRLYDNPLVGLAITVITVLAVILGLTIVLNTYTHLKIRRIGATKKPRFKLRVTMVPAAYTVLWLLIPAFIAIASSILPSIAVYKLIEVSAGMQPSFFIVVGYIVYIVALLSYTLVITRITKYVPEIFYLNYSSFDKELCQSIREYTRSIYIERRTTGYSGGFELALIRNLMVIFTYSPLILFLYPAEALCMKLWGSTVLMVVDILRYPIVLAMDLFLSLPMIHGLRFLFEQLLSTRVTYRAIARYALYIVVGVVEWLILYLTLV